MDYEVVILKPAELILKSKQVRGRFEKQLLQNVKTCLKQNAVEFDQVIRGQARYFIYSPETDGVIKLAKNLFGISKLAEAVEIGATIPAMKRTALDFARDFNLTSRKSFGVRINRTNTQLKTSARELEKDIGGYVQDETNGKVNLSNPDIWIRIDIVGNKAFLFTKEIDGLGGLPVGTSGKVVVLFSNPKDLLTSWMMLNRGCQIFPLHIGKDDKLLNEINKNIKKLDKYSYGSRVKLRTATGPIIKTAEKYAQEIGAQAIVLGSWKPKLLKASIPIFEPLVGLKEKDIKTAIKAL